MEDKTNNIKNYSKDILLITKYITDKLSNNKEMNNNIINNLNEQLFKFCDKNKYFNEKGTKILNEKEFKILIKVLDKYISIDDYIIPFFEKLNIFLIKVIINGYISYNLDKPQKEKILLLINKLIPLLSNNDYLYYIYNKLSKIFRLNLVDDESNIDETFSKFNKIFDIWKLIFNYDEDLKLKEKYITLYGNNNFTININNIYTNYISTVININFIKSSLLSMNKNIENFSLMSINSPNESFEIKLNDIKFKDNKSITDINSIRFTITEGKVIYAIDNDDSTKQEIKNDNIKNMNINKIELLNNFYGKISFIEVVRKYKKKFVLLSKITPNKNDINIKQEYVKETFANQYKPIVNILDTNFKNIIDNKENIDIILKNNSNIFCKYYPLDEQGLNNIKYFGGLEAFIPLFKILKYFILHKKNIDITISFIKDILKIILNKIFSSKNNLENFYDIIIPLTGAISEISCLLSPKENEKLFKNNIIYNLYIFIMISPLSKTAKDIFKDIVGISDINNLNIDFKEVISEKKFEKINSIEWYCFLLFAYIEYILLIYNDIEKVPKEIFEQLYNIFNYLNNNKTYKNMEQKTKIIIIIEFFIGIINKIYPNKIDNFKDFKIIEDLSEYINGAANIKQDLAKSCFLMIKIFLELYNLKLIKNTEKDSSFNKFYNLFLTLKNIFKIQNIDNQEIKKEKEYLKNIFKDTFNNYQENKDLLNDILDTKNNNGNNNIDFISQEEKLIEQFIDYERQYRHIMKEQFIFNRLWSNKKLFFDNNIRTKELKYKSINYYTENFQRPIVYPLLDYKNQYPSFSYFALDNNFYLNEETKDNYNFFLESTNLEELIEKYNKNNLDLIKNKFKDNILEYDVCLIKRTHHVKGKLFFIKVETKIKKIYFLSYPKSKVDNIPSCNYLENNSQQQEFRQTIRNKHVCYGSFFICPDKDCNIKIKINMEDIRMIIRRIYFYRKSAFEIFTSNKSYYFNFCENPLMENYMDKMGEINAHNILSLLSNSFNFDLVPIEIKNNVIGYSKEFNFFPQDIIIQNNNNNEQKENNNIIQKNKDKDKDKNNKEEIPKDENKFIDNLLKRWINENSHYSYVNNEISTFDIIILLNLLSNRSYNDLYQYPIFPVLYFYDKIENSNSINVPRTLSNHIGFQTDTKKGENRKKLFVNSYEMAKEEINDGLSDISEAYYFNTNYSNSVYICNYLLRIFPYSFIAIEIQGDGFDDPNRLFHSIENTFYTISYLNTDLREILPEFYFMPEMFININKLNFKKKSTGIQVDNVIIPEVEEIIGKNINNNKDNSNYSCFKYVEYMRNYLENKNIKIYDWLNIIFGNKQRYNDINKKEQYFRTETYFNFDKEDSERLDGYLKNDLIMSSVEFGLIPIQIIFNDREIKDNENNINYSSVSKNIIEPKLKSNIYKNKKYSFNISNNSDNKKDYKINENIHKYIFKKGNKNNNIIYDNIGKIGIYINDKLVNEFYDNKDIINYIDYNKRLNMFITTSIDGYSFLYSFPNKLLSVIKHPDKGFFDFVILSSNPFPSIITFDKNNYDFYSYSLNGLFITKVNISQFIGDIDKSKDININIYPIFDTDGGAHKDLLVIQNENGNHIVINVPFFEKEIDFV